MQEINLQLRKVHNSFLDTLVRVEIHAFRRSWSTFQICGFMGLALAILLAMTLVTPLGLSPWVMAAVILAALSTFFGLAMLTKIITGEERLTYYHHEIALIITVALLLQLLRYPVLPYLDTTILGLGIFLTCGRIGCLMVGCCHGQPYRWGVCYREGHSASGFTPYFVGVRLFPIQAVESLWVFGVVLVGTILVLKNHNPGEALAWYLVSYGIGRFLFELKRGDPARPYRWGYSEAQWTSLLVMGSAVWMELNGLLPFQLWHVAATAGLTLVMVAIALGRRFRKSDRYLLQHPHHVRELAGAVELAGGLAVEGCEICQSELASTMIHLGCTSLGVQLSASKIRTEAGHLIRHYAFSRQDQALTEETANIVAELILQLLRPQGSNRLIKGSHEIFHLLVYPPVQPRARVSG